MFPLRIRILIAIKFWLPRLGELGALLSMKRVSARTLAEYEMEKAKFLRTQLNKKLKGI